MTNEKLREEILLIFRAYNSQPEEAADEYMKLINRKCETAYKEGYEEAFDMGYVQGVLRIERESKSND